MLASLIGDDDRKENLHSNQSLEGKHAKVSREELHVRSECQEEPSMAHTPIKEEVIARELFQSPLSTVSNSPGSRGDCSLMSADAGSIPTEDDESASIRSQSSESVNDDDDSSTSDVSDASRGSYEESIPHSNHYDESEDDEYSDELEESEDELEFDDESEDGGGRRKRGSNKDAHVFILSDTDAVSAEK